MKNKIFGGIAVLALVVLTALNVNINLESKNFTNLNLAEIEAIAGEYAGWDNFWQGQGFYKDEEELKEPCPSEQSSSGSGSASYGGGSVGGSGSSSQTNPSTRHDIRCGYGNNNCTRVYC